MPLCQVAESGAEMPFTFLNVVKVQIGTPVSSSTSSPSAVSVTFEDIYVTAST